MIGVTFALTALALGFGALYPNYDTENVAEIPTSFGGLLFMMCAVSYLAGIVILEGWPVFLYLNTRFQGGEPVAAIGFGPVVLGVAGAALLTAVAIWAPLQAGISKVRTTEL
jgi:ABC-2 type transport system permease protein